MRHKMIFPGAGLLAIIIGLTGCFSSNPEDIEAFVRPHKVEVSADNYILQPPDEIEIQALKIPEIHLQRQRIRPDGMVSFEGLGEISAAGKTPKQLVEDLREKASMLYALTGENPIDVRISVFKSRVFYVLGQVYFEGPKVCTGRDTLLTALAGARPTILAWKQRIQVIKPSTDITVKPKIFEFDYNKMIAHGDTSKNVLLEEGDIVFVPPTILAAIGLVVEEALRPIGRAFSTVNIVQGAPGGGTSY